MEDEYEPKGDDAEVLEVIRTVGFANPYLIRQRTGLGKGEVNTVLVRLGQYGYVKKVTRGLYEYTNEGGRDCHDAVLEARTELESAEGAMQRNDTNSVRQYVENALETLNEVDA